MIRAIPSNGQRCVDDPASQHVSRRCSNNLVASQPDKHTQKAKNPKVANFYFLVQVATDCNMTALAEKQTLAEIQPNPPALVKRQLNANFAHHCGLAGEPSY